MRILITGGAGFVGSSLARQFKEIFESCEVIAFDNLKRRGSELNLPIFKSLGIPFIHGDIRNPSDFQDINGSFDLVVDASAEPSVLAGTRGSPDYVVSANLTGTFNCLNFARGRSDAFLFLSTSRVYSIAPLRAISLREDKTRFEIQSDQKLAGISSEGVSESFPVDTARSFYGTTKLAAEMLLQEFVAAYGMKAIVYRCGVIAGPGQFGKPDQGVFTFWLMNHHFKRPLQYKGFGGSGKQVRDLMHPADLVDLVKRHLTSYGEHRGQVFNVGGGRRISTSLLELSELCRQLTGNTVPIGLSPETDPVDVPLFITDSRRIRETVGWQPTRGIDVIFKDALDWIRANETQLQKTL